MTSPDVSVIVGVYNAMPYLTRCLESVEAQTIGADRMELIAVDDGSTDGSGEELDRFAAHSKIPTRVVHQANSGGPSAPRNTGLELATGRWVFFLDADDYFGDEALDRLVDMGERNGTDVVLGKVVGINRSAPKSMWGRNLDRTDVFSSKVKFTLSAQKLFRRSLLVEHGLRFPEELKTGEDAVFTLEAYLRADGLSVVADYDCYHLVGRDDGRQVTKSGSYTLRFDSAAALMDLIARFVPPGDKRDDLMVRPFTITLSPQFKVGLLKQPEKAQRHRMELAEPLFDAHWNDGVARRLSVEERLRLHLVAAGRLDLLKDVLEFIRSKQEPEIVLDHRARRAYLAYPHFRDPSAGIPDSVYDATGRLPKERLVFRDSPTALQRVRRGARRLLGPRLSRAVARTMRAVTAGPSRS
ncbi:glycosyltransferase family 2 protein [Wenjunlia tyrosinilytica]|uniref:Glycosyl transferase n=1 Tax=Wenjunlia tyrosinilytica TaxID=1544741 RepID=A0A917ZDK2_9ACTN|nr:glycosyltransferase [Wenjunlia tyrosinilytica]GGO80858.1 hypothetical protein GCM10012280_03750 [Wenjunlia tyrosinilytica]